MDLAHCVYLASSFLHGSLQDIMDRFCLANVAPLWFAQNFRSANESQAQEILKDQAGTFCSASVGNLVGIAVLEQS